MDAKEAAQGYRIFSSLFLIQVSDSECKQRTDVGDGKAHFIVKVV